VTAVVATEAPGETSWRSFLRLPHSRRLATTCSASRPAGVKR